MKIYLMKWLNYFSYNSENRDKIIDTWIKNSGDKNIINNIERVQV